MNAPSLIIYALIALAAAGFFLGRYRASVLQRGAHLHSQPQFHGLYVAFWIAVPALLWALLWSTTHESLIRARVEDRLVPETLQSYVGGEDFLLDQVQSYAEAPDYGASQGASVDMQAAAKRHRRLEDEFFYEFLGVVALLVLWGAWHAVPRIQPDFRARTHIERYVKAVLALCALVSDSRNGGDRAFRAH